VAVATIVFEDVCGGRGPPTELLRAPAPLPAARWLLVLYEGGGEGGRRREQRGRTEERRVRGVAEREGGSPGGEEGGRLGCR
jgi:hypothetical protein